MIEKRCFRSSKLAMAAFFAFFLGVSYQGFSQSVSNAADDAVQVAKPDSVQILKSSVVDYLLMVKKLNAQDKLDLRDGLKLLVENMGVNPKSKISADRVNAIQLVLNYTYENRIHCMRGEEGNKVYVDKDGREAVFDEEGNLVENDWNKGSFNYGSYNNGINKFLVDIFPWLIWGNGLNDPTSVDERFCYYLQDVFNGAQAYLAEDLKMPEVKWNKLGDDEKNIVRFFNAILFEQEYAKKYVAKKIGSAEEYNEYFSSVFSFCGFESR